MIIGGDFSKKNRKLLKEIGSLSNDDTDHKIPVQEINKEIKLDRTEIKNLLEYFEELGYITIATIGGPLLYGHIKITDEGLQTYHQIK